MKEIRASCPGAPACSLVPMCPVAAHAPWEPPVGELWGSFWVHWAYPFPVACAVQEPFHAVPGKL